jgi:hypothetical protein
MTEAIKMGGAIKISMTTRVQGFPLQIRNLYQIIIMTEH